MQCIVCKTNNPDNLTRCQVCESELIHQPHRATPSVGQPNQAQPSPITQPAPPARPPSFHEGHSFLLCPPMNPIQIEQGKEYSIGRDRSCTVILASNNVSRINTLFNWTPDGVFVVDNDSRNGTFLNGVRMVGSEPSKLKDGDEVRIGPYNFIYRIVMGSIEEFLQDANSSALITEETMDVDVGDISGDFSKIKCADILQMIELTKKTGLLVLNYSGQRGCFYFANGAVIHATFQDKTGKEAALAMIPLKEGSFKFDNVERHTCPQTIKIPTHKLILDSLRQHDEGSRELPNFMGGNPPPSDEEILGKELSSHIPKFDFFSDLQPKGNLPPKNPSDNSKNSD